jgi:hypothetical protein
MDANVHRFSATVPDLLLEFEGHYEDVVVDAAQIALRAGVTTLFDTWGPLKPLTTVAQSSRGAGPTAPHAHRHVRACRLPVFPLPRAARPSLRGGARAYAGPSLGS